MKTFGWLATVALLAMPALAGAAEPLLFNGNWKTLSGGSHTYTVTLKQIDTKVTGSFSPGNGKIFDGVVVGTKLTFKWTQDGGYEGTGEFTMNEDGKSFTGSSSVLKPKEFTVTWNSIKPPTSSFAGNWDSLSNSAFDFPLVIEQQGDKVTGTYPKANGTLEGTVTGRLLRFKWKSAGGSGTGRLVLSETGDAFFGTYNYGDNPDDVDNTWNGKRAAPPADKPAGDKPPAAGDKPPAAEEKK